MPNLQLLVIRVLFCKVSFQLTFSNLHCRFVSSSFVIFKQSLQGKLPSMEDCYGHGPCKSRALMLFFAHFSGARYVSPYNINAGKDHGCHRSIFSSNTETFGEIHHVNVCSSEIFRLYYVMYCYHKFVKYVRKKDGALWLASYLESCNWYLGKDMKSFWFQSCKVGFCKLSEKFIRLLDEKQ